MRLLLLYPENQEGFAQKALKRLERLSEADVVTVAIAPGNLRQELLDNDDADGPLLLVLSKELVACERGAARELWAPLLRRVETGGAQRIGIILLDELVLPPLLLRARWAEGRAALRALESWVIGWSKQTGESIAGAEPNKGDVEAGLVEFMLDCLVDESALLKLSCPCPNTRSLYASEFASVATPYFETVHSLFVPHKVEALRDAVVAGIKDDGRALWILNGYEGPLPLRPEHASILIIGESDGIAIPPLDRPISVTGMAEILDRSLQLIALTPNVAGIELPFSTFEYEEILPRLFEEHWVLAERLARKAGVFFRLNHRIAEAKWLYEELRKQAELQGRTSCVQDCESELSWLRAGGVRKGRVSEPIQGGFAF